MAISETNIIPPEPPKPGIPVKKSTLGFLALAVALATFGASLLLSGGTTQQQVAPSADKPTDSSKANTGTSSAIEEEQKQLEEKIAREARTRAAPAVGTSDALPGGSRGSPIPDDMRRSGNEAAIFDKQSGPGRGRTSPQAGGKDAERDLEMESLSRSSRVLVLDEGGASAPEKESPVLQSRDIPGFPSAAIFQRPRVPSESMPSSTDAVAAMMRTSGIGAQQPADPSRAWLKDYAGEQKRNEVLTSYPTVSRFTLHQGKVIPAVLARRVNSDLPGEITAFTTMDVYDSLGNGLLLIPKGSALVGRYDSGVKMGQERLMFAFQRIIMPNGEAFDLPAAGGSDLAGAAGVTGDVNNHFFKMFSSSFLVAWSAQQVAPTTTTSNGTTQTSPAGQVLVEIGRTILERNRRIPPTITIDQGTRINVEVAKDMEFAGPYLRSSK
jgi:type IV secretory pathway VirB10-like protein